MNLTTFLIIVPLLVGLVLFVWGIDYYKEKKLEQPSRFEFEVANGKIKTKAVENQFLIPKT